MNLFMMEVIPNVFEKYAIEISVFVIIATIIMNIFRLACIYLFSLI